MNDNVTTATHALGKIVPKSSSGTWRHISRRADAKALYALSQLAPMLRTPGAVIRA